MKLLWSDILCFLSRTINILYLFDRKSSFIKKIYVRYIHLLVCICLSNFVP